MPSATVPENTVTFSSPGCQCGAILYPAGTCARTTNGPAFDGSPAITATFALRGRLGGGSPHLIEAGSTITCWVGGTPLLSALKMSSLTFHFPSACFFQTSPYFPFSGAPPIVAW